MGLCKVIGLSGKIGSGKTTTANYLVELFGYTRLAFGDVLKRELSHKFGIPEELCYTRKDSMILTTELPRLRDPYPAKRMTVRELLQWYGTDYCRKYEPGYWVRRFLEEFDYVLSTDSMVVVEDVRFLNEAECINRTLDGLMFRLEHYSHKRTPDAHRSETELDNYKRFMRVFHPKYGNLKACAIAIHDCVLNYNRYTMQI